MGVYCAGLFSEDRDGEYWGPLPEMAEVCAHSLYKLQAKRSYLLHVLEKTDTCLLQPLSDMNKLIL